MTLLRPVPLSYMLTHRKVTVPLDPKARLAVHRYR